MSNPNSGGRGDLTYKHRKARQCKFRGILGGGKGRKAELRIAVLHI
jgi:hypothetical protein